MSKKIDQSIRSEGAECFVRAILMMEFGIITSQASRNMPGYDIVAHNLQNHRNCKISVKFRTATNADGFRQVGETRDYDILVAIIGNRGRVSAKHFEVDPKKPFQSQIFIFTKAFVVENLIQKKGYDMIPNPLRKNCDPVFKGYKDAWHLITEHLGIPPHRVMRP